MWNERSQCNQGDAFARSSESTDDALHQATLPRHCTSDHVFIQLMAPACLGEQPHEPMSCTCLSISCAPGSQEAAKCMRVSWLYSI